MKKPFTHTFNYTKPEVFQAVKGMIVSNAKQFNQEVTDETPLEQVTFSYGKENPITVKVMEVVSDEKIIYHTQMEKRERYEISFVFSEVTDKTAKLEYHIDIVTENSKIKVNYSFMKIFYKLKQKKQFRNMCNYLDDQLLINKHT